MEISRPQGLVSVLINPSCKTKTSHSPRRWKRAVGIRVRTGDRTCKDARTSRGNHWQRAPVTQWQTPTIPSLGAWHIGYGRSQPMGSRVVLHTSQQFPLFQSPQAWDPSRVEHTRPQPTQPTPAWCPERRTHTLDFWRAGPGPQQPPPGGQLWLAASAVRCRMNCRPKQFCAASTPTVLSIFRGAALNVGKAGRIQSRMKAAHVNESRSRLTLETSTAQA